MLNDKFCVRPFVHGLVDTAGEFRPCCRIKEDSGYNINDHSVEEWWNSDYMNSLREKFINGEQSSACWRCWRQEEQGVESFREYSNRQWSWHPGHVQLSQPIDWELQITNLCNLKCMMCNPQSSSQILIEDNIIMGTDHDQKKYNWNPDTEKKLIDILNRGKSFVLRGGEPFIVPFLKNILKSVNDQKEFLITTNATKFDSDWLDILSKHKIKMCLSIDAYQDLNHYIRFPSDWQLIIKNIELMSTIPDVNIFVNTCVQNLNILHLDKLLEWAVNEKNLYVHLDLLTKPPIFELRNLPDRLIKEARRRLVMCRARLKPNMVEGLDSIIDSMTTNDVSRWQEFVSTVKKRDAYRGVCITDYLPELGLYFND